jgi:HK97 family phage major capsid protein
VPATRSPGEDAEVNYQMETPEQLRTRITALKERITELDGEYRNQAMPAAARDEWNSLNEELDAKQELIEETEIRHNRLREIARDPARVVNGATNYETADSPSSGPWQARDEAMRTLDRYNDSGELRSNAAETLERLVKDQRDPLALTARYLTAAGDPNYTSAFGKILQHGPMAPLRFSPEEQAAVQKVNQVESQRGLVTGTGSAGGLALPIVIDPSVLLTSTGALNPIRQVARVITTSTTEWRGVSSAGVTASYDAEASEVSDDTPTFAQPTILTEMARAFVPFSIEIGEDWGSLQEAGAGIGADARDLLDAAS